ncbi:MAG: HAMP domain-containing sensor histidine kinase [Anaerolineae bacterium]
MPINWLTGYGPSNLEALIFLIVLGALIFLGVRRSRRRWQDDLRQEQAALAEAQRQNEHLQTELAEIRTQSDPARLRAVQDHLQRVIAHEFVKGLYFILSQGDETARGLRADQADLRDRQNQVRTKAHEMIQHARNIVELPNLERNAARREMINLRGLLEGILKELFPYAEARGVHLQTQFGSLGPISVNRPLAVQMYRNVIHNAIHYSFEGGVVDVTLYLDSDDQSLAIVDVRDRGRGIEAKDQERIFELDMRGDGMVEPGSGLGLYHARKVARLHGGDVTLVQSHVNEGSTFRILLPYGERGDT